MENLGNQGLVDGSRPRFSQLSLYELFFTLGGRSSVQITLYNKMIGPLLNRWRNESNYGYFCHQPNHPVNGTSWRPQCLAGLV